MLARSPSPDRPKKGLTKRIRVEGVKAPTVSNPKPAPEAQQDTIDVGMLLGTPPCCLRPLCALQLLINTHRLLASLPPASLLPILTSLITKYPALKQLIIPLIPRPTLDAALQALIASIKKIRDTYPYSQHAPLNTSFGFGLSSVPSSRDSSPAIGSSSGRTSGMRESYIQNRIRLPLAEFASTASSYLVYFTSLPSETQSSTTQQPNVSSLPPVARNLVYAESSGLLIRLHREWVAWLDRIAEHVNRSGGMYGEETVRTWERGLDEMVASEDRDVKDGLSVTIDPSSLGPGEVIPQRPLRTLRDAWITKVGWLIGRRSRSVLDGMDEDEEL
ncbi:uncharacterized protein EI90DRAFT_3029343 [Cantharellus anzutake]|uniref:uncharacterized protein n=1 Tax=Cantharellus anzutake TaxID=1750568 RepID=UPI001906634E|nr:uncharacterized protein EI90DRAFT_3029343 [Cantharellus anzutake]KAF8344344.1 hypothetical protein EI90DRAFT_3029343 [Cantharellus anzutake]